MTHAIYQFGDVVLMQRMIEDDLSSGNVESSLMNSVGGVFDYWGADQRLPRVRHIPFKGLYVGEIAYEIDHAGNFLVDHTGALIIAGEDETQLRAQVDTLTAMVGQRASLYRRRDDDLTTQWITARLMHLNFVRTLADVRIAPLELLFESGMVAWHDNALTTTSKTCAIGTNNMVVEVDGSIVVQDATFRYTATTTTTSVRVRITALGVDWTWTGTMGPGGYLDVDAGNQTVKLTGGDAYSGFVLNSGHIADTWLPLAVGNNTVAVTVDATGTAKVEHYDQWL